ncbi:aldehyde dehydrogenase [Seiridium cupressi]
MIGGKSRPADKYDKVMDPRAEEELQDAPTASTKGLDDAVAASQEAFKSFRWSTNAERRELLLACRKVYHKVADTQLEDELQYEDNEVKIKVILETASNHASIVCEDSNLAEAVPKVAQVCLFHAGQICVAAKRIYVHEMIYDEFLNMLKENKKYAIAEDASMPLMFDPLSNRVNYEQCLDILDDRKKNGHNIITGGEDTPDRKGFWIAPIIVTRPPEDSYLVAEEQFGKLEINMMCGFWTLTYPHAGPIIPVMSWADETDVIARSNIHNGGLGASFHTPDLDRAQKIARQLESGTVWINKSKIPHHASFVEAMKLSGYGGELGKQALLSYCYTDISIWEVMQCKKCMRAGLFL